MGRTTLIGIGAAGLVALAAPAAGQADDDFCARFGPAAVGGTVTEPRFDGVAELWWDSVDDFVGRLAEPAAQAASAALLADEATFIDLEATSIFLTEEHEIIPLAG